MAFSRGPKIVTDGLVVYLDAANSKCYNGEGSDVSDIVGINTTQLNGVSFTSNNGGSFNFDGTNDYISFSEDIIVSPDNQGWSAEYWFKTTSATKLQHFNSADNDEFNANWVAIYNSKLAMWNRSPGYWKYGSTIIQSNIWYQAVFVCDEGGTNYRFYINGQREGGDHDGNVWNAEYSSFETRYIGRYEYMGNYSRYFIGQIPVVKFYNRPLTDSEISRNFDAQKTRFGL